MTDLFPKPINPSEAAALKKEMMPGYVIEAFNQCIAIRFNGHSAEVEQREVVKKMMFLAQVAGDDLTKAQIFDNGYLDVEPIYELEGWKVSYDKPGYNEDYEAFFTFRKKK